MVDSISGIELLGQYINIILMRINYAAELNAERKPYLALINLKPVLRTLLAATDDEEVRENFKKWVKKIDEVDSIQGEGATKMTIEANMWNRRNSFAMRLYEELETSIWSNLGDLGFFNIRKMAMWNPSQGAKTGEQKVRPGLPMTMSARAQVKDAYSSAEPI